MPSTVYRCSKCHRKLIEREANGLWCFEFGKRDDEPAVVRMKIHGSVKMYCLRRSCKHLNTFDFFPQSASEQNKVY